MLLCKCEICTTELKEHELATTGMHLEPHKQVPKRFRRRRRGGEEEEGGEEEGGGGEE
jgi:hypothetical protein